VAGGYEDMGFGNVPWKVNEMMVFGSLAFVAVLGAYVGKNFTLSVVFCGRKSDDDDDDDDGRNDE